VAHGRCRFLTRAGGFTRPRPCGRPAHLRARGATRWTREIRGVLPRGRYLVTARSYDVRGLHSPVQSANARVR
jgi:hypothetical protein